MNVVIEIHSSASLVAEIDVLAEFRLRYFREFPYLYVGTEQGERTFPLSPNTLPRVGFFGSRQGVSPNSRQTGLVGRFFSVTFPYARDWGGNFMGNNYPENYPLECFPSVILCDLELKLLPILIETTLTRNAPHITLRKMFNGIDERNGVAQYKLLNTP